MKHEFKLNKSPFEKIANGTKTIEFRLYDKKRQKLNVGDEIVSSNSEEHTVSLLVTV